MSANWRERPKIGVGTNFNFFEPVIGSLDYLLTYTDHNRVVLVNTESGHWKTSPVCVSSMESLTPEEVLAVVKSYPEAMTVTTLDGQTFELQDWLDWMPPAPDRGDRIVRRGQRWRWEIGSIRPEGLVTYINGRLYVIDVKTGNRLASASVEGSVVPARQVFIHPSHWTLLYDPTD